MNKEKIVFRGKIIAIAQEEKQFGEKTVVFEKAIRSPGVRLIVPRGGKLLLTREFRHELGRHDHRLAGGKVVDTLEEYLQIRDDEMAVKTAAETAAKREAEEELGIKIAKLKLLNISRLGATVEWDLYYFLVEEFTELQSQSLEAGEEIKKVWVAEEKVRQMCLDGSIDEERSAIAILRFLDTVHA